MVKPKEPELQDEVKNVKNDTVGTVIAKYDVAGTTFLDIRVGDERVYYKTPMYNWEVIKACEE